MVHRNANKDGPPSRPRTRLEGWLVRKIHTGALERLPSYFPLGSRGGQSPEQFALRLLAELRKADPDPWARERLEDDGRAFRSWAELVLDSPAPELDVQEGRLIRSVFA
jgi:hypothetical protein